MIILGYGHGVCSSPNDEETPRAPPRRRKSNVELSRTSRTSSNMENMAAVDVVYIS